MDLFGKAVLDYHSGIRNHPLYFTYTGISSQKTKKNVKRYFRRKWRLTSLEKKLVKMAMGRTLDIGCATGYYLPYMRNATEVLGIDISDDLLRVCRDRGLNNCFKQDIYSYNPIEKFDTITLLENNIGLGGSEDRLKELLLKIRSILKPNGQVLSIQNNFEAEYLDCHIKVEYGGEIETIIWSYMNIYYLKKACETEGFRFDIVEYGKGNTYLSRLTLQ